MKRSFLLVLLIPLLASCLGYKELPVEYDYSYQGNFKKYRTFEIMRPTASADTSLLNQVVEKSIISRMKFLGYRQSTHRPHLLIGFRLFTDSLQLRGYVQPDIEVWAQTQREDLAYYQQKFHLKTGTLLIHFYDRRENRAIWQGYATTLYGHIDFRNNRHLKNAVISILDKYRFWADGFVESTPLVDEKGL
ncbi:MAG: DUF4136 domain-containing protein [Cytophagales bacterium]|nr:DUF4136 domain-containing protein [Cytophagales bacterium]